MKKLGLSSFKFVTFLFSISMFFSLFSISHAAHPLITDDTGTQRKGRFQIELNSEFNYEKERSHSVTTKETGGEVATIISYGVTDNIDIVLGLPYQWFKVKEDGDVVAKEEGISDTSLELKWRFFEHNGLSLALKPGITFPTGDEDKGLGTGRITYSLFFITTKELDPFAFHLNLGYIRNENKVDERKDIWHASLAGEYSLIKDLRVVGNIGIEKNPDKGSNTNPAFILGGVIYSISESFDIDAGVKAGLNKPETDLTFLAGIALRF